MCAGLDGVERLADDDLGGAAYAPCDELVDGRSVHNHGAFVFDPNADQEVC